MLIFDEVDCMLDMGFVQDIEYIVGEMCWCKQILFFLVMLEGDVIQDFVECLLEDLVEVFVNFFICECKKIYQWYYCVDDFEYKIVLLVYLLKQLEVICLIVFVCKCECVYELVNWLCEVGINNCYFEGEMVQGKCNEVIKCLIEGCVNVLVVIDVVVCGIDIFDVSYVFNFDMLCSGDIYLYCIGCIVCVGCKGIVILLVEVYDYLLLGKVGCYIEELIKVCVIDELCLKMCVLSEKQIGKLLKKVLVKCVEKKKVKEKEKLWVKKCYCDIKNIGKCCKLSGMGVLL